MFTKDVINQSWNTSSDELPWKFIRYFSKDEFDGHTSEISGAIVYALNEYRNRLNKRILISPANWGTHSKKSWHSRIPNRNDYAQAIDIFPNCKLSYAWICAIKTGFFRGIGIYPYWKYPEKNLFGGLHLDLRKSDHIAMWWANKNGEYNYFYSWSQIHRLFSDLLDMDN